MQPQMEKTCVKTYQTHKNYLGLKSFCGSCRSKQLEDHYTLIGEPGEYYLTHFFTENGKGRTIAQKIFKT